MNPFSFEAPDPVEFSRQILDKISAVPPADLDPGVAEATRRVEGRVSGGESHDYYRGAVAALFALSELHLIAVEHGMPFPTGEFIAAYTPVLARHVLRTAPAGLTPAGADVKPEKKTEEIQPFPFFVTGKVGYG